MRCFMKLPCRFAILALTLALGCPKPGQPLRAPERSSPRPVASSGAVASGEPVATRVGIDILRAGGNAADAAVAVALALAVVHPQAGNLGGGGFAVLRKGDVVAALDFRETAPAAARRDMFLDAAGAPIPDASIAGPLAAGVPGTPAGLWELHRARGRLAWAEVVAPAVALARDGFVVSPRLSAVLSEKRDFLARFPESAGVWLPGGAPLAAGTRLRLPRLAATLEAYGDRGPQAIMSGAVARAIERASSAHGGILTGADLSTYRPIWREPLRLRAFGWEIASMPLPSSGGIILGETLLILERLGWPEAARTDADAR